MTELRRFRMPSGPWFREGLWVMTNHNKIYLSVIKYIFNVLIIMYILRESTRIVGVTFSQAFAPHKIVALALPSSLVRRIRLA